MEFKLNKEYSSRTIQKYCKNIVVSGAVGGGKHIIQSNGLKFVMLLNNAWRGTNSFYYKCVKI